MLGSTIRRLTNELGKPSRSDIYAKASWWASRIPKASATVSGTTTVTISATGGTGYQYTLKRDGVVIYSGTNATFSWNTTLTATVTASGTGAAPRRAR